MCCGEFLPGTAERCRGDPADRTGHVGDPVYGSVGEVPDFLEWVSGSSIGWHAFAVSAVFHAHANDDASRSNTKQYSEIKLREEK